MKMSYMCLLLNGITKIMIRDKNTGEILVMLDPDSYFNYNLGVDVIDRIEFDGLSGNKIILVYVDEEKFHCTLSMGSR